MKLLISSLILLCLVCFVSSITLEQIIFSYLETGETFKYEETICSDNTYEIVTSGGEKLFIFEKTADRYYFVNNKTEIKNTLMCFYENYENRTLEGQFERLEEAKEGTKGFFDSRGEQEETCKQYTGIDRLPCEDQTTCLVACRTVYICGTYAFGIGYDFIDLIIAYKSNTEKLDKYENEYEELFDDAIEEKTLSSLEEIKDQLSEISKTSKNIELSDLTILYSFCPEISYKTSDLTSAKSIVLDIEETIAPLYEIDDTVNTIYSETNTRKADYEIPKGEINILMLNGQIINVAYFEE